MSLPNRTPLSKNNCGQELTPTKESHSASGAQFCARAERRTVFLCCFAPLRRHFCGTLESSALITIILQPGEQFRQIVVACCEPADNRHQFALLTFFDVDACRLFFRRNDLFWRGHSQSSSSFFLRVFCSGRNAAAERTADQPDQRTRYF